MPFETDKSGGFKIDASELLKQGVYPERFDRSIPFWETVDGVQFTEFGMKRKAGRELKHEFASSPTSSTTPIRGITATVEFDDKVAYIGDLDNIYSYKLSSGTVDTVGSGYSLLETSGATVWDSGSTVWLDTIEYGIPPYVIGVDVATVWDEGVNQSDQWDFEIFGSWVVGAKGSSKPVIKKSNTNFNTFHDDEMSGVTVTTAGTNYAVGDTLNQSSTDSAAGTGFTCTVTEITATDNLKEVEITNFGSLYLGGDTITLGTVSGSGSGAVVTVAVPDIDFDTLKAFHKQGPHMLAFNYTKGDTKYETSFAWCSADDLDTWTASATNTAGSLLIREADTPIMCVSQIGRSLAVYTENQMFLVSYVGLPNIFGYQVALENGVGAVSPNSVVSVGRQNFGLSRDGFFVTDGSQARYIGRENGMNEYFRDNAAQSELGQVYAFDNSKENEVVWALPINSSSISKEVYYNYKTNQWGMRNSTVSAYLDRGIFQEPLSGKTNGKFYFEGNTPTIEAQNVSAVTKAHDLNNADKVKELSAIRVGKEGNGSPQIRIGWSSHVDAAPTWNQTIIIDDTFKSHPLRTAGRYIHLEVTGSGAADDWTITDMVFQGRFEGER